jgi:hypothetical protein
MYCMSEMGKLQAKIAQQEEVNAMRVLFLHFSRNALSLCVVSWNRWREHASVMAQLGAVINGTNPGRTSDHQITLFDGTGVGLQDLAVAAKVVDLAVEQGVAIDVDF